MLKLTVLLILAQTILVATSWHCSKMNHYVIFIIWWSSGLVREASPFNWRWVPNRQPDKEMAANNYVRKRWRVYRRWEEKANDSAWCETRIRSARMRVGFLSLMCRMNQENGALHWFPLKHGDGLMVLEIKCTLSWLWLTNQQKEDAVTSRKTRSSDASGFLAHGKKMA